MHLTTRRKATRTLNLNVDTAHDELRVGKNIPRLKRLSACAPTGRPRCCGAPLPALVDMRYIVVVGLDNAVCTNSMEGRHFTPGCVGGRNFRMKKP